MRKTCPYHSPLATLSLHTTNWRLESSLSFHLPTICMSQFLAMDTIPANPDIAGVGSRTSIYTQIFLGIGSAVWALSDGKVTAAKLEYAETQATTNLILAFAILISSMVQASTLGISNHHANIVLMMSWMNNTNAFSHFILYIHHKTGLPGAEGGVGATWKAWVNHAKRGLFCKLLFVNPIKQTSS
jgi:hypothetical protein